MKIHTLSKSHRQLLPFDKLTPVLIYPTLTEIMYLLFWGKFTSLIIDINETLFLIDIIIETMLRIFS